MKSKKLKKYVKGMTLIEVIVALAIFVVMTLIMVQVGSVTKALMLQTNHMNRKTAAESPIASVQDVTALNNMANEAGMVVQSQPITFRVSVNENPSVINAVKYSSHVAGDLEDPDFETNMRGDLEFYVVEPPTEAPTT